MRFIVFIGALCVVSMGPMTHTARSQPAPNAENRGAKSGYALLLEAGALMKDGPDGYPSAPTILAPAENLRRQRAAVARDGAALAKLREALRAGIRFPPITSYDLPLPQLARARELARLLWQEGAVRAADGDALGAARSSLDALELGVQIARGSLVQAQTGKSIVAIARQSLQENAVPLLSAAQLRQVAADWETIGARMPSFAQTLRDEESVVLAMASWGLAAPDGADRRAQIEAMLRDDTETDDYAQVLRAALQISIPELRAEVRRLSEIGIERAALPYQTARQEPPLQSDMRSVAPFASIFGAEKTRFFAERDVLNHRLFLAALRLRAAKLETGAYPQTFDAEIDPFSPTLASLVYRAEGEEYRLYSVGPDGKDDGGAPFQTFATNPRTGDETVTGRLSDNSTGDIVAPVF